MQILIPPVNPPATMDLSPLLEDACCAGACLTLTGGCGVWVCTRDMLSALWWVRVATKGSVGVVWGQGWAQSILTK